MTDIKYLNVTVNGISLDNNPAICNTLWLDTDGFANFVGEVHDKGHGMSIMLAEEDVQDFVNFLGDGHTLAVFFDDDVQETVENIYSVLVDYLEESK